MAEKDGHCEPQSRRNAVRWVALDIVGAEEGDSDLMSDGEQGAKSRLPKYVIASPVSQLVPLIAGRTAFRRNADLRVDRVPGGPRAITLRLRVPINCKNVTVASQLKFPRFALG